MGHCPMPPRVFAGAELKLVSPSCRPTRRRLVAFGRISRTGGFVVATIGLPGVQHPYRAAVSAGRWSR